MKGQKSERQGGLKTSGVISLITHHAKLYIAEANQSKKCPIHLQFELQVCTVGRRYRFRHHATISTKPEGLVITKQSYVSFTRSGRHTVYLGYEGMTRPSRWFLELVRLLVWSRSVAESGNSRGCAATQNIRIVALKRKHLTHVHNLEVQVMLVVGRQVTEGNCKGGLPKVLFLGKYFGPTTLARRKKGNQRRSATTCCEEVTLSNSVFITGPVWSKYMIDEPLPLLCRSFLVLYAVCRSDERDIFCCSLFD